MTYINHKWKDIDMTEDQKKQYSKMSICIRGDCGCIRQIDKRYRVAIYVRNKMIFDYAPECTGEVAINEQTID